MVTMQPILIAAVGSMLFAAPAMAEAPSRREARALLRLPKESTSLGRTNGGRLLNAAELPKRGTGYRLLSFVEGRRTNHGTTELIRVIERATAAVHEAYPGALLGIGNLGFESGEKIPWSVSHQAGRDADLGMYATTLDGEPIEAMAFYDFDADGLAVGPQGRTVRFDVDRNLRLVQTLVEADEARVQYIFVATWLKEMLLAKALERGVGPATLARLAEVLHQPTDSNPHANHYHLRLFCTVEDRLYGCLDRGPPRAWVDPGDREHAAAAERVAAILTMTGRSSVRLKVEALERLAAMRAWSEIDAIATQLSSSSRPVRRAALNALTEIADSRAIDAIIGVLPSVADAGWATALFDAIPALTLYHQLEPVAADDRPDPLVALAERVLTPGGVEALLHPRVVKRAGSGVRVRAIEILRDRGAPRHVPLLLQLAEASQRSVRRAALDALARRSCRKLRNAAAYRAWFEGAKGADELSWIAGGLGGDRAFPEGIRTRDGVRRLIAMLDKRRLTRICAWRALVSLTGHDVHWSIRSPRRNKQHWTNWWANNVESSALP